MGPKLAARIVTELKDKIVTIPVGISGVNADEAIEGVQAAQVALPKDADYSKSEDVISALVNLGYQRLEAYRAVSKAMAENPDANVPTLIRLALKEFAQKEF